VLRYAGPSCPNAQSYRRYDCIGRIDVGDTVQRDTSRWLCHRLVPSRIRNGQVGEQMRMRVAWLWFLRASTPSFSFALDSHEA